MYVPLACPSPALLFRPDAAVRAMRSARAPLLLALALTFLFPTRALPSTDSQPQPQPPTNEAAPATRPVRIIVRPKPDADRSAVLRLYEQLQCRVVKTLPQLRDITILELPAATHIESAIAALQQSGLFVYAEADQSARALMTANDSYYQSGQQWALSNAGGSGGTAGADIRAERAWNVITDASSVLVAVVDSGIRATHEDLAANMWTNPGESGVDSLGRDKRTNGVDDDSNGYVDDVHGINVLNHSGNTNDDWGHGTHVAGVVGAVGNNGVGMAGIAWRVRLMACKFIDQNGNYTVSDAVTALDYARQKGARIVTAAWGGYTFTSSALRDAVTALRDADIILVAATGNDGTNNDANPLYPASYEYSNIIAVAATDRNDGRPGFSNYGAQTVDLGAPGADILSAWAGSNSDYRTVSGTSMASSHVAGACALLRARFPSDSHQQIIQRILSTVDHLPALAGRTVTGGRLNLAAALSPVSPPSITSTTSASATLASAFSYQITATNSPRTFTATNLSGTGLSLDASTGIISGTPTSIGTITSQLTATNDGGTSAPVTLTITVTPWNPNDTTPPSLSSFAIDLANAGSSSASFVVTFSENVIGVDVGDFAMTTQGTATASISGIVVESASRYRVNFNFGGNSGAIQMAIKTSGTGIMDGGGNYFVGHGVSASEPVPLASNPASDVSAPRVTSFTVETPSRTSVSFVLSFNESVTGLDSGDFLVISSGGVSASLGTVSANSNNTVFTIPVTFSGTGTLQLMALGGANSDVRDNATNWYTGGSGQQSAVVSVSSEALPPSIYSSPSASATVGVAFRYEIIAAGLPTRYAATNLTGTGLSLNTTTGVISGTPVSAGTIVSILTASNASGTSAPFQLTINVAAAPLPPTLTSPTTASAVVGSSFSYQITATGSPTQYAATNLSGTGLSLNTSTGLLSGTPIAAGSITTQLTGTNAAGTSSPLTLTITVTPAGSAPTITSATSAAGTVGSAFSYQITASGSPTQYSATNLAGTGLSLNVSSGLISGTPGAAGTITSQLSAANSFGTSAPRILVITINPPAVVAPVVGAATIEGTVGRSLEATVSATNNPTEYALTGQPPGISINTGTGAISGAPTEEGTFRATVSATNAGGTGRATLTFVISAPPAQQQTVTFAAPTSALFVGQPIRLGATASSGLPVTYTVISGAASIAGDMLTASAAGTIVVRATQEGNAQWASANATTTLTAQRAAQSISAGNTVRDVAADARITLDASASSNLPVVYTLVSGPGTLTGNVLTFTGATGTVVVRASQPGNQAYNPATAIDLTFRVVAVGQQIVFGRAGNDDFGAAIGSDNTRGMFVMRIGSTGEALVVKFNVEANGTFSARGKTTLPRSASGTPERTITGTILNGVLSGRIEELGTTFSGNVQPTSGPASAFAGLYISAVPGASSGEAYLVLGPNGQAFGMVAMPTLITAGTGTVNGTGSIAVTTGDGSVIAGQVAGASTITGTLKIGQATYAFSGLGSSIPATDRLVNISSRLRVFGNDVSRSPIAGFVVVGDAPKLILIRAIGPGLSGFGVTSPLPDPQLRVFDAPGRLIASNSGWNNDAQIAAAIDRAGAFKLASGSRDAAVLVTLTPGAYTAQATSANSGLVLIEAYDVEANAASPTKQLVNISTRGHVGTGDDVIVGGFVVSGNEPKRVLVRGIGPGLAGYGVSGTLADPVLRLYNPQSVVLAQNDNWGSPQPIDANQITATQAEVAQASVASGAFPLTPGSTDAVIVITLNPGPYTAIVSGAAGTTGSALLEVYEIPNP